ncbi:MAG: EamA family transporter [Bacteroidales bacterium]|nr:EamA family transporter [Bacteroidales bacterium]
MIASKDKMIRHYLMYFALIGINFIYACTTIFTKSASQHQFLSLSYILWLFGAVGVMGVYALLWQQVIKRMPIAEAYMFKGTSLIFVLLLSVLLFGETITLHNIIGAIVIIVGIVIYARS